MQEQRAADAAVATPADDATDAGPQAAVLELPAVPLRAAEGRLPLPGVGAGVAHLRLLGVAPRRPGPVDARTVNSRNSRVRQSRFVDEVATALDIPMSGAGRTTWKRPEIAR